MEKITKKNIAFVSESGKDIGYGHLYRAIAIAESFLSKGCEVTFFCNEDVNRLINEKLPGVSVNKWNLLDEECSKYDIIVFDVHRNSFARYAWLINELNRFTTVTIIDYAYREYALPTDMVFQVGYRPYKSNITENIIGNKKSIYYSGTDYLIFRKEFDEVPKHIPREKAQNIMVSMGGSDPSKITEKVAESIELIKFPLKITYFFGSGFSDLRVKNIKQRLSQSVHNNSFQKNVNNMAMIMSKQDIAIINGGNTRFELAKLGVPFLTVSIHEKQQNISAMISNNGIGHSIGVVDKVNKSDIAKSIKEFINNKDERNAMSDNMKDGFALSTNSNLVDNVLKKANSYGV